MYKRGCDISSMFGGSLPKRIQRKRTKGFNLQAQSPDGRPVVSVCRPGKWGNQFVIKKGKLPIGKYYFSDRKKGMLYDFETKYEAANYAVKSYRESLTPEQIQAIISELAGKHLACFCPLDSPCHADVLIIIANEE